MHKAYMFIIMQHVYDDNKGRMSSPTKVKYRNFTNNLLTFFAVNLYDDWYGIQTTGILSQKEDIIFVHSIVLLRHHTVFTFILLLSALNGPHMKSSISSKSSS